MADELNLITLEEFFYLMIIKREIYYKKIRRALNTTSTKLDKMKVLLIYNKCITEDEAMQSLTLTEKGEEKLSSYIKSIRFFIGDFDKDKPEPLPEPDYKKIKEEFFNEKSVEERKNKVKRDVEEETVKEEETDEDEIKEPLIIFTETPEEYDDNVLKEAEKDDEEDNTI